MHVRVRYQRSPLSFRGRISSYDLANQSRVAKELLITSS